MAATAFDLNSYTNLLTEVHPTVPQTESENQRLIGIVNGLTDKDRLSLEEKELLELLLVLIRKFEDEHYTTKQAAPNEVLLEMMRAHAVKPKDLYEIFGSKGTTSEVLRGKRAISKSVAKALAARFGVSVNLFL